MPKVKPVSYSTKCLFTPCILPSISQCQPLLHIARKIVAYGADKGREGAQPGGLEGCVAHLRDGFDCPIVVYSVCLQIEIVRLVVAADGDSGAAPCSCCRDRSSGVGRPGQIGCAVGGPGLHSFAVEILILIEAARRNLLGAGL